MDDYELQYEKYLAMQEARQQLNEMRAQALEEDNERRYAAMEYREKYGIGGVGDWGLGIRN